MKNATINDIIIQYVYIYLYFIIYGGCVLTEKELKKLTRLQLLELLILQTNEIESLQEQLEELKEKKEIETIEISKLGSIAEASLRVNSVFKATQQAADLYLNEAIKRANAIILNAKEEAKEIIRKANEQMLQESEENNKAN